MSRTDPGSENRPCRLLVPMNIEALVVGKSAQGEWVDLTPDFRGISRNRFLGQQRGEPGRETVPDLHEAGIHLHWALPDGLLHGAATAEGDGPEFPFIPNRWAIVRFQSGQDIGSTLKLQCKAWILESDTLANDGTGIVWPDLPSENNPDYHVRLGRVFEIDEWPPGSPSPKFAPGIRGIGYGDPAFAAYYPACRGILAFHDGDIENLQNVTVSYFVAGWYSDPSRDPLFQPPDRITVEHLEECLAERKWTFLKEETQNAPSEGQDLPTGILCHGVISGICWKTKDTLYKSGVPYGQRFSTAVGNTAVEALTALFRNQMGDGLAHLIEAFQYDLLDELERPGGERTLAHKVHERSFRPLFRGRQWELFEESPSPAGASTAEKTPSIPGDVRLWLENLNNNEGAINGLRREVESLQSELYALWYKKVLAVRDGGGRSEILLRQMEAVQQEINQLAAEIAHRENEAGRPKGAGEMALPKALEPYLPGWKLREIDAPCFWQPNDPVVLLAGKAFQRSLLHGEDGWYRADGCLLCRLADQVITALKLTIPNAIKRDVPFGPGDLDAWCRPYDEKAQPSIPPEVYDLFRESLLLSLDEAGARAIAFAAYEKNEAGLAEKSPGDVRSFTGGIERYLEKLRRDAENPDLEIPTLRYGENDGAWEINGKYPSPVAVTRWRKNPWLPLFLSWQVMWMPCRDTAEPGRKGWSLDDEKAAFVFAKESVPLGEPQLFEGITLLTPSATLNFRDRLRRCTLTHDAQVLRDFQDAVQGMNLLCQSLGGFTDQLLMRKARLEMRPLEPGEKGRAPTLSPIYEQVKDIQWLSPLTEGKFFPLRHGQVRLERLWVIDAFGQVLKLDKEKIAEPFRSGRLAGPEGIQLEPRLAQPARLSISWPPARSWGDAPERDPASGNDDAFNPVCGWILPNFLDMGLMIYDARGNALGALQSVQRKSWAQGAGARRGEIESFHWIDVPGSPSFFFGRPVSERIDPLGEQANPHLRAFVNGLRHLAEGKGQAFGLFLEGMNKALSAAGRSGFEQNPNLALLMGKPLALVRAAIRLELDGRAARDQGWNVSGDGTGGIESMAFPLRLGDRREWKGLWLGEDGLAGFYVNLDYTRFYPASGLEGDERAGYLEYGKEPVISIGKPLELTLLMDPSRGVCVTSGIVPRSIFHLPYGDVTETLENKQVMFFTGPLLSTGDEIRMPQPADIYGQWSWTHHPEVKVWREENITDSQKEEGRFFDRPLQIAEGWLKLITAPLEIRSFSVKGVKENPKKPGDSPVPDQFQVSSGRIVLTWAVTGAEEITLRRGGELEPLFVSMRHPLPRQYQVEVKQDTSFTVIAVGRAEGAPEAGATAGQKERTIEIKVSSQEGGKG